LSSPLDREVKRVSSLLRESTIEQIRIYQDRFAVIGNIYKGFLERLIINGYDYGEALKFARRFFVEDEVWLAAVDGSRFVDQFFDMVVFYGGAFASLAKVLFLESDLAVSYSDSYLKEGQGISSCVPLYVNQVLELDQTFISKSGEEIKSAFRVGDTHILENTQIADSIMHFAEYYLAYRLLKDPRRKIGILLFDRTLSGDQAALIASTSNFDLWKGCAIYDYEVEGEKIDLNDLAFGRYALHNEALDTQPARGDYLKYRILWELANGPKRAEGICQCLGVSTEGKVNHVLRQLEFLSKKGYVTLDQKSGAYLIKDRYRTTWARLKKLVVDLGEKIFLEEIEPDRVANKLLIECGGSKKWVTTLDLNFLTLMCLYMIVEEAWKNNILLVGVTKDTAARDFKMHFTPILSNAGLLKVPVKPEEWLEVPSTDRMILQVASMQNPESVQPPWSLIEYDAAFKTLVPGEKGPSYVRGAIRDKISPERIFMKSYIQLLETSKEPKLRSNVLCIDRLAYPEYDLRDDTTIGFKHSISKAEDEIVRVIVYKDKSVSNPIQNFVLTLLSRTTHANIPELFGHNKPLFIADKIAKWHTGLAMKMVRSVKRLVLNNPEMRSFLFYMSTFRERREGIERGRRRRRS